jgi:hypothetical protein
MITSYDAVAGDGADEDGRAQAAGPSRRTASQRRETFGITVRVVARMWEVSTS